MKSLMILMIITFASCDNPQRIRQQNVLGSNASSVSETGGTLNQNPSNGGGSQGGQNTNDQLIIYQNAGCSADTNMYNSNFGYFGFCKHPTDVRKFTVTFAQSHSGRVCFYPMASQVNNSNGVQESYKLGPSFCLDNIQADQQREIVLERDPTINGTVQPSNAAMNSIMMMFEGAVVGFDQCQRSKENAYIDLHMNSQYQCCGNIVQDSQRADIRYCQFPNVNIYHAPYCQQYADNAYRVICSQFSSQFSTYYTEISLYDI